MFVEQLWLTDLGSIFSLFLSSKSVLIAQEMTPNTNIGIFTKHDNYRKFSNDFSLGFFSNDHPVTLREEKSWEEVEEGST